MEEERLVKLAGLDSCDLFYPVALLFQVIYLLLHVVEFTIGNVGNVINVGDVTPRVQVLRAEVPSKLLEEFKP